MINNNIYTDMIENTHLYVCGGGAFTKKLFVYFALKHELK